ncbi:hypothetical protein ABEB36_010056 [Hypothenemus hampei]|uniref:Uncharacterized protein n=1 Tax=Hypothenemus hampei TaxID=57062 RepID=A0ABD1EIG5_HYPHA
MIMKYFQLFLVIVILTMSLSETEESIHDGNICVTFTYTYEFKVSSTGPPNFKDNTTSTYINKAGKICIPTRDIKHLAVRALLN